ncbi:glycosyltransferase [Pectobacterium punjabense]|uniref:glycosyltransferase n=1 Tax=Pectobacterium punjabense TaxID=2108399 RepID=UPI0019691806|nr:glycosyltransferase [Pectobacterium punjabense]MBN3136689.1 glycosyltransferase [Pectobacterium punjabense]MCE5381125.1 glycosyltransferase [Pectobacterium punjabense]
MSSPLVSIIVAAYNAERYIKKTLDSCIQQTYQNIEIIITDDGSTDNTVSMCREWCNKNKVIYPHVYIALLVAEKNSGIPKNINKALAISKGKWIKCIGSDDLLCSDAIHNFLSVADNDIGVVFSFFETFGEKIHHPICYPFLVTRYISSMNNSFLKKKFAMLHFNNVAPGAFINRDYFTEFDPTYNLLEDLPLWLKFIHNDVNTVFINKVTVNYRIHDKQVTSNMNLDANKLLYHDLKELNKYRLENKYYIAYLHHAISLFFLSKTNRYIRGLRFLDPVNIIVKLIERIGR